MTEYVQEVLKLATHLEHVVGARHMGERCYEETSDETPVDEQQNVS